MVGTIVEGMGMAGMMVGMEGMEAVMEVADGIRCCFAVMWPVRLIMMGVYKSTAQSLFNTAPQGSLSP